MPGSDLEIELRFSKLSAAHKKKTAKETAEAQT